MNNPQQLVTSSQITPDFLDEVFSTADKMSQLIQSKGRVNFLADKIIALLFLEPSSRTMMSFQSAAQRLEAGVLLLQGKESSSLKKRESIQDTIKVASGYCDLIVARLPEAGSAAVAADSTALPFINAGDGSNEHPTQAIVDLYTIRKRLGRLNEIHIAVGLDPLQSRAIHSLVKVLSNYSGIRITFIGPDILRPPQSLLSELRDKGADIYETEDMDQIRDCDVIYFNRLQEERFDNPATFELYRHRFSLTRSMLTDANKLVLDPLPRVDEISHDVDDHPAAAYFEQAHNGVPIRMALLCQLLDRT
jgi:aspartate carbamoyltransferase